MDVTFVIGNNSWKFHDDAMMGTWWKRCDGRTDRRTDGLNQSYSCSVAAKNSIHQWLLVSRKESNQETHRFRRIFTRTSQWGLKIFRNIIFGFTLPCKPGSAKYRTWAALLWRFRNSEITVWRRVAFTLTKRRTAVTSYRHITVKNDSRCLRQCHPDCQVHHM